MTLKEIAEKINVYLKGFENDPEINQYTDGRGGNLHPYWHSVSFASGKYLGVTYISYQGPLYLKKADAEKYLEWLVAGNVGKHWAALKEVV